MLQLVFYLGPWCWFRLLPSRWQLGGRSWQLLLDGFWWGCRARLLTLSYRRLDGFSIFTRPLRMEWRHLLFVFDFDSNVSSGSGWASSDQLRCHHQIRTRRWWNCFWASTPSCLGRLRLSHPSSPASSWQTPLGWRMVASWSLVLKSQLWLSTHFSFVFYLATLALLWMQSCRTVGCQS